MDHQRFKQVATDGTTLYLNAFGVMAELIAPGTAAARWNDYLSVGNVKVGVRFTEVVATTVTTRYFHTDHLGSIAAITNEAGAVIERFAYDAWGKRRFPDGTDDPAGTIESETTRGFTGHEQLDVVGLVHMNGRVYDPMIGRMISPDPIVPDALNAQAWNRYSYVGNDPLTFTDPTGHSWLSSFFHAVANVFKQILANPIVRAIAQIVVTAVLNIALPGLGLVATAALGSAIVTGLSGGNLGQMLRAAAIAGATAFAFDVVGGATNAIAGTPFDARHIVPEFGKPEYFFNVASHAAVGCASAAASGGRCQDGALSGAVGAAGGPLVNAAFPHPDANVGDYVGGLAATSALGGLASVAGGGKFENGAVTAAFGYMYNFTSNAVLRAVVPGQVAFDRGMTALEEGRYGSAAANFGLMLGEQVLSVFTLGASTTTRFGIAAAEATTVSRTESIAASLEQLGGGIPRSVPTPKGATQFIFPNGTVMRFDINSGQFLKGQGPHINLQNVPGSQNPNIHIPLSR